MIPGESETVMSLPDARGVDANQDVTVRNHGPLDVLECQDVW